MQLVQKATVLGLAFRPDSPERQTRKHTPPPLLQVNLSHNHVSQIHVKTFPYSRWIPYRLEELDLSSNKLAVIGRDFSTGLKDLKKLNLANNSLIETRKCEHTLHTWQHVVTAMTSLPLIPSQHFDMARTLHCFNLIYGKDRLLSQKWHCYSRGYLILHTLCRLVTNISVRFLTDVIGNLTKLEELDLSHNQLAHFPENSIGPNVRDLRPSLFELELVLCDVCFCMPV